MQISRLTRWIGITICKLAVQQNESVLKIGKIEDL
jgi:hypothetical protein